MAFIPSDPSKIQNLSVTQLADCPWPIAGSHCSPCTIYLPSSYQNVFNIWGAYAGDTSRERIYAQQACTDYSPIMRFVCQVGRFRTTAVPTNDGLFIGLVTLAVLNDNTKLHDPSQWQWAGYLATLTGGTPVVPSWICADVNLAWTPATPLYLVMATNGSYEVCGWDMCGYYYASFPQSLYLNEYNYNEPGKPNGWTQMDYRFKGAIHVYSPPAGQTVEGYSQIANPVFCTTVQSGANCAFSFDVNQLNAFPCGCPETIVWQIFNRDTGAALGNAVSYALACGYTGVTGFGGNLVFSGAGVFHGQLKAGHLNADGTTWTVDTTYNFDVTVTALPCTTYTTKATCQAAGCYWWNGSCHSANPTACTQLNNQTDCTTYGCFWCNGACQSTPCDTSVNLDKAVTVPPTGWAGGCDPITTSCACGSEPATKTTFAMSDTVVAYSKISATDLYGKVMKHEWWWNGTKIWEYTWPALTQHWNYACYVTYWPEFGNSNGPGSGNIKILVDGVYLGSTNTFTVTAPDCTYWTTQSTCQAAGCEWWNGSCHSTSPTCTQLNNQTDCLAYSCYWYSGSCHSTPQPCTVYTTQVTCIQGGCFWYNGSCHSTQPTCTDFNNQTDCLTYFPNDCYWYNNSCHSTPGTAIGDIDLAGSTFYTSFMQGQQQALVAKLLLLNTGYVSGVIYTKYFYQPTGGSWTALNTTPFQQTIAAGGSALASHHVNIPNISGTVLFGVKVWSEDETEPTLTLLIGGVNIW